jgi:hypothetical protein
MCRPQLLRGTLFPFHYRHTGYQHALSLTSHVPVTPWTWTVGSWLHRADVLSMCAYSMQHWDYVMVSCHPSPPREPQKMLSMCGFQHFVAVERHVFFPLVPSSALPLGFRICQYLARCMYPRYDLLTYGARSGERPKSKQTHMSSSLPLLHRPPLRCPFYPPVIGAFVVAQTPFK